MREEERLELGRRVAFVRLQRGGILDLGLKKRVRLVDMCSGSERAHKVVLWNRRASARVPRKTTGILERSRRREKAHVGSTDKINLHCVAGRDEDPEERLAVLVEVLEDGDLAVAARGAEGVNGSVVPAVATWDVCALI